MAKLPLGNAVVTSSEVVARLNSRGTPLYHANIVVKYDNAGVVSHTGRILPFGNLKSSFECVAKTLQKEFPVGAVRTVYLKSKTGGEDFIFSFGAMELIIVGISLLMLGGGVLAIIYGIKNFKENV